MKFLIVRPNTHIAGDSFVSGEGGSVSVLKHGPLEPVNVQEAFLICFVDQDSFHFVYCGVRAGFALWECY